jgi:glycosyltransferase involved in cell wall biosynthesis
VTAERLAFVVPEGVDDPARVSGGNVYDRRVRDGLLAQGWEVRMVAVDTAEATAGALSALPDDALVLIDGLLVPGAADALVGHARRLREVVLAHQAPDRPDDRLLAALRSARRVIATSAWTRSELVEQDAADPHRITVARPGTDPAPVATSSPGGGRLLCVAAVAPHKGHDLLVRALAGLSAMPGWTCVIAGSLDVDPDFAAALTAVVESTGLAERVTFAGVLGEEALGAAYARADLLVHPSRSESYGMVVADALAHGVPVLTTGVGGIPEAIGDAGAALIVPPDDPWALQVALQRWWSSAELRERMRAAALDARRAARSWGTTTAAVAEALAEVAGEGGAGDGTARDSAATKATAR